MAIFSQPLAEGRAGDVERGGRFRDIPAILLEYAAHMGADRRVEIVGDVGGRRRGRSSRPTIANLAIKFLMLGDELCEVIFLEHDGTFKDVQKFAHIAGI